jgi:uncharacterized protein
VELTLLLGALALALAGLPHCAAMCAAPCAAATGGRLRGSVPWAFHGARLVSYSVAGAVAAGSVGALAALSAWAPALRPLWTLLHAGAFVLGLWMVWQGCQPLWLESLGRSGERPAARADGRVPIHGPLRAGAVGAIWVAWPCGLLQSALVLAALANGPAGGALVMAGFGAVTAAGLLLGPAMWRLVGGPSAAVGLRTVGVRLAGAALVAASGWALTSGLWAPLWAYCFG